jgi:hypothetical protein
METKAPPRHQVPSDEFCSRGVRGGATFNLGHYKKIDVLNAREKNNVFKHTFIVQVVTTIIFVASSILIISTQDETNHESHGQQFAVANKGGLGTTRFGKGFQRKNERDISNPVKDVLTQIAADTETRKECLRQSRSEFLKVVDAYNGYDPISCKPRTNGKMQTSFIVFVGFETSMYRNITSP